MAGVVKLYIKWGKSPNTPNTKRFFPSHMNTPTTTPETPIIPTRNIHWENLFAEDEQALFIDTEEEDSGYETQLPLHFYEE